MHEDFIQQLYTEEKAYLFGWLASEATVMTQESIVIQCETRDQIILEKLKDVLFQDLLIFAVLKTPPNAGNPRTGVFAKTIVTPRALIIHSVELIKAVCQLLNIEPEYKAVDVALPQLKSEELTWAFIRGYFDGNGEISSLSCSFAPECKIATTSNRIKAGIKDFCQIKCQETALGLEWTGNNVIDFLGKLYDNAKICSPRKRNLYLDWASWVPGLSGEGNHGRLQNFRWAKSKPNAFPPFKQRASDSGFDLTLIEKVNKIGEAEIYDTGIKVQPEYGWYFVIAPRSSLFKTGYMPGISMGIIDRTYVGSILVPLIKYDKNAPDLQLPARVMQILPTPIVHVDMVEVEDFEETNRGAGGLGSSGNTTPN